jgi:hypothetical protein
MSNPNCPYCQAEERGISESWGGSPEYMEEVEKTHYEKHCLKCPTCGQPVSERRGR